MKKVTFLWLVMLTLFLTATAANGEYTRPKGATRFRTLSGQKAPIPSAELDAEFNNLSTYVNGITLDANISEWNDPSVLPTYISANSFTLPGNHVSSFSIGRRVKIQSNGEWVYSDVATVAYSSGPNTTTVTITDSILTSPLSFAYSGILSPLSANGSISPKLIQTNGKIVSDIQGNVTGNVTGTLTGNVTGNADTATLATNVVNRISTPVRNSILYAATTVNGVASFMGYSGSSLLYFENNLTNTSAKVWTAYNTPTYVSGKYGSAITFNGSTQYIDTPNSTDFNFGTSDLTIECWIKKGAVGTAGYIAGQSNSTFTATSINFVLKTQADNTIQAQLNSGSTVYSVTSTATITDTTTFHHVAIVRVSGVLKLFIDGVQSGGNVTASGSLNSSTNKMAIGRLGEYVATPFNGAIDDFRIINGYAAYTTNFTPPTVQLANFNFSLIVRATTVPIYIAFADGFGVNGAIDYVSSIITDTTIAVPASSTNYIYADRNTSTGAVTLGTTTLAPAAAYITPASPASDQHWFDMREWTMKRYNGASWDKYQRVFLGKVVSGTSAITSVTSYSLRSGCPPRLWSHTFTTCGSFNVPDGVTELLVTGCGAGGNGGAGGSGLSGAHSGGGGGGGGGGAYVYRKSIPVTASQVVTVTIGASGGGTTSVGGVLSIPGGSNGGAGGEEYTPGGGGGGGFATISPFSSGSGGGNGSSTSAVGDTGGSNNYYSGGGGGGSCATGSGGGGGAGVFGAGATGAICGDGRWGSPTGASAAANSCAGGGGGGGGFASGGGAGGAGGSGKVILEWYQP